MKTRNRLTRHFSFLRVSLISMLALASIACGAAPGSQGEEGVESSPPSAVDEGADAGSAAPVQARPDPIEPVTPGLPQGEEPVGAGLRPDHPPPAR
jgi:hypothetical protein